MASRSSARSASAWATSLNRPLAELVVLELDEQSGDP